MIKLRILLVVALLLPSIAFAAMDSNAKQAIVVDDVTGQVLFAREADTKMHPSSMSKLMTIYVVMKRLKEGTLSLTDTLPVSEQAWRTQGSKTFVELGNNIAVEDLLRGVIVQSGNDACVVLAEGLSGTEQAFAGEMNKIAAEIGLKDSHFTNSTGWPDPEHLMTARDLATLAQRLIHDFPEYYHYFAETEFTYHKIRQPNRNTLLGGGLGVDGLKTGHTEDGGYGITVSAKQGDRRIIVVVNGLSSMAERIKDAENLVRQTFLQTMNKTVAKAGEPVAKADVWMGKAREVSLVSETNLVLTLPKANPRIKASVVYDSPIPAPIKKGDKIAELHVTADGLEPASIPLVAAEDVEQLSPILRIFPALEHYLTGGR